MRHAISRYSRPFLAIVALASIGIATAAYILAHQRLRFPLVEDAPVEVHAEFATAQAVVPGQGQTVRVAGVRVGDVGDVRLRDGYAVVTLELDAKYDGLVRDDATALLRPKTGLKDMFVELDPGRGRPVEEGFTIPRAQTAPDVNLDEFNSMLDADTRDYLKLLVHGAGRGLSGRGRDLREVFRMFEPTHRDLRRVSTAVASRRDNLRRLVHSLRLLSEELGHKEDDLAELVSSASRVLRSYASEADSISLAIDRLPAALRQTTETLRRVDDYADLLGPTADRLRPAVRALGRSNAELRPLAREATPLLRSEIGPLVRELRPFVRNLDPATSSLSRSAPDLTRSFRVFNRFVNQLGHNPRGREGPDDPNRQEGFLFYAAWIPHNSSNLFSTADAHGALRPSLVAGSCQTARGAVEAQPELEFLANLTPLLTNEELCGVEEAE